MIHSVSKNDIQSCIHYITLREHCILIDSSLKKKKCIYTANGSTLYLVNIMADPYISIWMLILERKKEKSSTYSSNGQL